MIPEGSASATPAASRATAAPAPSDTAPPLSSMSDASPPARSHRLVRERRPSLGRYALALAVLMVALVAVALGVDAPERYLAATVLALLADAFSAAALIVGIVALVRRRCVVAATFGVVIAVLGNPLVLLHGLGALA
ncbi:hypothetical protein GCM10009840_04640 [Pseudolysinimonas kribbensis]